MTGEKPKFVDSPFFYVDKDGWHLKPGAPADTVKEFTIFVEQKAQLEDAEIMQEGRV